MEPDAPILPKTYVRTLAGDMETVQKGGVPEFVPVRERSVVVPVVPKMAPPIIKTPMIVATEAPTQPVEARSEPVVEKKPPALAPLRTYSGDFSDRMKETKASTATILAAEQDLAGTSRATEVPEQQKANRIYLIGGIALLVIGVVGVYIAYDRYLSSSAPIAVAPAVKAPIFVDERQQISGSGITLLRNIEQSVVTPIPRGSVRFLYFEGATTTSVFSALNPPAPGILLRNINAAQSMAGVIFVNAVQSPFFILSVTSYGETFAGMLQWESTMPRDLAKLFPAYPQPSPPQAVSTTTATSTQNRTTTTIAAQIKTPAPAVIPGFRDEIVSNHDARVYRDAAGHAVLLYGYWNQTTLVIARSTAAFTEILGRLATSRLPAQAGAQP